MNTNKQSGSRQRGSNKSPIRATSIFIDVNGDGKKTEIAIQALANSNRTHFHGEVDGRPVNSIVGIKHGASMVLTNGKSGAMAATDDELMAFSVKYLQDAGHTVQFKAGTQITVSS